MANIGGYIRTVGSWFLNFNLYAYALFIGNVIHSTAGWVEQYGSVVFSKWLTGLLPLDDDDDRMTLIDFASSLRFLPLLCARIGASIIQIQVGAGFQIWVGSGLLLNVGFSYVSNTVALFRAGMGIFAVGKRA